jgi:hypothetical protein
VHDWTFPMIADVIEDWFAGEKHARARRTSRRVRSPVNAG